MSYRVYARRFRPQTFDEIVGQDHITTTLKNAITIDRLAHAYLFTGPRGTGKTSTARIFAMALNCKSSSKPNPCNKCNSCEEIKNGTNLDLIEIDGASNRGIDDIRNLRENIKFQPTSGKFKVYIIDETHMLTQEAFNALLKTLEEPPAHVKIVLATTQPHKVPPTIASRCQRFDFRRIPIKEIVSKLKEIAKKEKISIKEDSLFEIAKISEGSLRDAESMLEQLGIFSEGKIEFEDITDVLGLVSKDIVFSLTDSFINKDSKKAILLVDKLINDGKDITQLLTALIEHFRNLLVAKITPKDTSKSGLIELSKEQLDLIIKQAAPFSIQDIFYIINVLIGTNELIRKHQYAKIILEVAMVKLTQREDLSTLREILDNLSRIEISKGEPAREIPPTQQASIPQSRQTKTSAPVKTEPPQQDDSKNRAKLETIRSHWGQLMQTLEKEKMSVATFMLEAKPVMVNNGSLVVGLPEQFTLHRESLEAPENRKLIEDILAKLIGQSVKLEFTGYKKEEAESNLDVEVPQEEEMPQVEEVDLSNEEVSSEEINEKKEQVDDSLVNLALKIFNGKVVKKDNDTKQ